MSSFTTRAFGASRERLAAYAPRAESAPALTLALVSRAAPKRALLTRLEPADGPLQSAVGALRAGTLSARELVGRCLAAMDEYDPSTHAVVFSLRETALMQARVMDDEASCGQSRGPLHGRLHGIPFSVKDNISTCWAHRRAPAPRRSVANRCRTPKP